jgi:hypothetical protein
MTRAEFEAFMTAEGWSKAQRDRWARFVPTTCNPEVLRSELRRPDGIVEVTMVNRRDAA